MSNEFFTLTLYCISIRGKGTYLLLAHVNNDSKSEALCLVCFTLPKRRATHTS